jgi:transposase-like protein
MAHRGVVTAHRACNLSGGPVAKTISYAGYRFPPEIIQRSIWLYFRLTLSFRDFEDVLAERGITVSYETVRRWVNYFGRRRALPWRLGNGAANRGWRQRCD